MSTVDPSTAEKPKKLFHHNEHVFASTRAKDTLSQHLNREHARKSSCMVIHIRALLPEEIETRTTKHAGTPNLVCSSAPLANPNKAQAFIKETGAAKTQKQDMDTGTRRSHKAHDSCSDISGASCQGGSEGHRSEFRNTLCSIGFASWSSAPLPDFMFLSQAGYQRTSCPFVHLGTGASVLDQR